MNVLFIDKLKEIIFLDIKVKYYSALCILHYD